MIDLHVHSNRSDGTFTPTELVDYAIEKGLSAFALTDHDTVNGLEEAIEYARKLRATAIASAADHDVANITIPTIIPGIEFSTEYQGRDIHIVGLDIDYKNSEFTAYLKDFVDSRILRNQKMCALLQEAGIDITYEKLLAEFPDAVITRAHYAAYLLHHGYTKSLPEAFERYVGDHCPYFVPREKVTPAQAVKLVLKAGGIPVLAHPVLYRMSDERLDKLVAELKEAGLVAIEAIYSTYNAGEERRMRALAAKYDLLISGGSDFHGSNKTDIDLGTGRASSISTNPCGMICAKYLLHTPKHQNEGIGPKKIRSSKSIKSAVRISAVTKKIPLRSMILCRRTIRRHSFFIV